MEGQSQVHGRYIGRLSRGLLEGRPADSREQPVVHRDSEPRGQWAPVEDEDPGLQLGLLAHQCRSRWIAGKS
jgi:hypothetical protein